MSSSSVLEEKVALRVPPSNSVIPDAGANGAPAEADAVLATLYSRWYLLGFVLAEIGLQLLLASPLGSSGRVFLRTGAFAVSFVFALRLRRSRAAHPAWPWAVVAVAIVALSTLHPETNSFLGGVATACLHLSLLAPIFWVPRIRIETKTIELVFLLLWIFNAASAAAGVLQTYYPGRFDPPAANFLEEQELERLQIQLADGSHIVRPLGLTAGPGGAAISGTQCIVFAVALLLARPRVWSVAVLLLGIACSAFSLYLCQVRAAVVTCLISLVAMVVPLVIQRRFGRLLVLLGLIATIAVLVFFVAVSVGGDTMVARLATLIESDPGTVYDDNRGLFLRYTFSDLITEYPLGAGLARWGMLSVYFGDRLNAARNLWAEIEWTGWLYDGGAPLVAVYAGALLTSLWVMFRLASRRPEPGRIDLQRWATAIFGYSVGMVATTFANLSLNSTGGIEFWILNSMVFAAYQQSEYSKPAESQRA
jgi:hypothetical protein